MADTSESCQSCIGNNEFFKRHPKTWNFRNYCKQYRNTSERYRNVRGAWATMLRKISHCQKCRDRDNQASRERQARAASLLSEFERDKKVSVGFVLYLWRMTSGPRTFWLPLATSMLAFGWRCG